MSETQEPQAHSEARRPRKTVYTIIEGEHLERSIFLRVGTAFTNRDDSINVYLDAMPVNGKLHIRDYEPKKEQGGPQ